jgi:hypothetical protein
MIYPFHELWILNTASPFAQASSLYLLTGQSDFVLCSIWHIHSLSREIGAQRIHGFERNGAGIALETCRPFHAQTQSKEWFCRSLGVEVRQLCRLADLPPLRTGSDIWQPLQRQRPHEGLAPTVPVNRYKPSRIGFADLFRSGTTNSR